MHRCTNFFITSLAAPGIAYFVWFCDFGILCSSVDYFAMLFNTNLLNMNAKLGKWLDAPSLTKETRCQLILFVALCCPAVLCDLGQFECDGGTKCILDKLVCDGLYDCTDQTDELFCRKYLKLEVFYLFCFIHPTCQFYITPTFPVLLLPHVHLYIIWHIIL